MHDYTILWAFFIFVIFRVFQSVVFNIGQKMVPRAFYFIKALTKALHKPFSAPSVGCYWKQLIRRPASGISWDRDYHVARGQKIVSGLGNQFCISATFWNCEQIRTSCHCTAVPPCVFCVYPKMYWIHKSMYSLHHFHSCVNLVDTLPIQSYFWMRVTKYRSPKNDFVVVVVVWDFHFSNSD